MLGLKTVGKVCATTELRAVTELGERGAESARPRGFLAAERFCVGDMLQSSALRGLRACERMEGKQVELQRLK
jgi:hypothetical protein